MISCLLLSLFFGFFYLTRVHSFFLSCVYTSFYSQGLAIRDYWDLGKEGQKDDKYVVLVVDQFGGKSNVLNFNVGDGVKLNLPNIFWTRLQSEYGTLSYVRDNGIDLAITNAVDAIVTCLRSEDQFCTSVPKEAPSLRSMGLM
jgi:hypothetical protein